MNPQDITSTAFNGGLLCLFAWVVKWAAGTFAKKQEDTTTEMRGVKEAIIELTHLLKDFVRRDEDDRRTSRDRTAAPAERHG